MARRNGIRLDHTSHALTNSSGKLEAVGKSKIGRDSRELDATSEPIGKKFEVPLEQVDKPSVNLKRPLRGILLKLKHLPNWFRSRWLILHPKLTPDQLEERHALAVQRARDKLAMREGRAYARLVSHKLAQLGMREIINSPSPDKPRRLKLVKWSMVSRDELFTKVVLRMNTDPRSLPSYVQVSKLALDPLFANELLPTLAHFVKWDCNDGGVFLTIFRHGLDGLPDFVACEDLWKKIPESKPPLTFPVGYGANSERIDVDLDDCPHLIVAGATKQGKSNFINQMICFWLWRGLMPTDLQLILFDLKRGMEFTFYEGLPHLYKDKPSEAGIRTTDGVRPFIETGIIEDLSGVLPAMHRVREIMDDRMLFIKRKGHKDFNAYNRTQHSRQSRMPALVVIFDEWARVRLQVPGADSLLAEMTNLARAAGIYFILGTQNPNREVISALTAINFSTRVVFHCSIGGSMAALGDQSAKDLDIRGRAILQDGGDQKKVQTPRISDTLIRAVVYKATTGKELRGGQIANGTDLVEILEYALDHMDANLDILKLYNVFREKGVRQHWLQDALRQAEGQDFVLSGKYYTVLPRGNHLPRRMVQKI